MSKDTIDTTMMYVVHNAFLRDLDALTSATDNDDPSVRATWDRFKTFLHIHHTAEDTHLWPVLRGKFADQPSGRAVLAEMEREHVGLTALLAAADSALSASGPWITDVQRLNDALTAHCEHEEERALPLIADLLTPAEWTEFGLEQRRQLGRGGGASFLPWLLDGANAETQRMVLGQLPPPARLLYRVAWRPRYLRGPRLQSASRPKA